MEQKLFFIILIIFLLSNEFYFLIKNILKYGLYVYFIYSILKIILPNISTQFDSITKYINGDLLKINENTLLTYGKNIMVATLVVGILGIVGFSFGLFFVLRK
jgi:hypothetical protein